MLSSRQAAKVFESTARRWGEVSVDLWRSLVLAAAGGALTLLGTWAGYQFQAREQRRVRAENLQRDGLLRLHRERVAAYTAFYREGGEMRAALSRLSATPNDLKLGRAAIAQRNSLWDEGTAVTLIGSQSAADKAWDVLSHATEVAKGREKFDSAIYNKLIWQFIVAARADLIFPDAPETPLSEVWRSRQRSVTQDVNDPAIAGEDQ